MKMTWLTIHQQIPNYYIHSKLDRVVVGFWYYAEFQFDIEVLH